MNRRFLVVLGLLVFPSFSEVSAGGEIAVIVSKVNPTDAISFKELVKIFKQEKQYWGGGKKIYLILREAGSAEKQLVLKRVYEMEDEELKKFWLGKLFRQEIASFPKTLSSNEAVKRFVSQVPNAVGVIDASFVDDSVKVLRIDGKGPGESGYALSSRF